MLSSGPPIGGGPQRGRAMRQAPVLEQLIEVASRLKDSVGGLYEAYSRMPEVIRREERAIAAHDYVEVRDQCEEKEVLASRIETLFAAMTASGDRIYHIATQVLTEPLPRPSTLSQYVELLQSLCAHYGSTAFAGQVLAHVLKGLQDVVTQFFALYLTVKPQIEGNRCLVATMLSFFQQSYRFWAEVSEQHAVPYNKSGVQQASGRNHGFKARA